jgi:hypothetical protein
MLYPKNFGRAQIRRADYILNGELIGAVLEAIGSGKRYLNRGKSQKKSDNWVFWVIFMNQLVTNPPPALVE